MRALFLTIATFSILLFVGAMAGSLLPHTKETSRKADFKTPPDIVWAALTHIGAYPSWRSGLVQVDKLPAPDGHPSWREHGRFGQMTFTVVESKPFDRLSIEMMEASLPFAGAWYFSLGKIDGGTVLTVTQKAEISNPLLRLISRTMKTEQRNLDAFLDSLGKKLGQNVSPISAE